MEPQNPYPRPAPSNPLDFSVIGEAFNYVKSNPGPFIVATLLAIIPTGAAQGLVRAMQPTDPNQQLAFLPINFGLGFAGAFLAGPGNLSLARCFVKARRGEAVTTNDATFGFSKFLAAGLMSLIIQVASQLGILACCVGILIVGALLMGSYAAMAHDESAGLGDALMNSIGAFKDHVWKATWFYFVCILVILAGILACGVGLLVSVPVGFGAMTLAYLNVTERPRVA
ncbi:MAG: hypothetical protein ACK5XS_03855 [Armatimonadota bacterium]|jgi:hypothetical protein|nr:hypothetical protein [Fimbriimonadaceae bacterium]MCZ8139468.1 hypothetical protein [Fimbriimonadaceae bacterium]